MTPFYFYFWKSWNIGEVIIVFADCVTNAIEKIEKRYNINLNDYQWRFEELIAENCDEDGFIGYLVTP